MLVIGDKVKVIGPTLVGTEKRTPICNDSLCIIIDINIDEPFGLNYAIKRIDIKSDLIWWYPKDSLEKYESNDNISGLSEKEILNKLVNHNNFEVRLALAELGYGLDVLVNDVDSAIREEVAKHGRDKDLDILVNDKSWWVRLEVAKHRRSKDFVILINDEDPKVRNEVLKQRSTIYEDYITDKPTKDEIINELIPSHTDENTKKAFKRRLNITNCRFPFTKK